MKDWHVDLYLDIINVASKSAIGYSPPEQSSRSELFQQHKLEILRKFSKDEDKEMLEFDNYTILTLELAIVRHFTQELEQILAREYMQWLGIDIEVRRSLISTTSATIESCELYIQGPVLELTSDLRAISASFPLTPSTEQGSADPDTLEMLPTPSLDDVNNDNSQDLWLTAQQRWHGSSWRRALRRLDAAAAAASPRTHAWLHQHHKWILAQCFMILTNVVQSELV